MIIILYTKLQLFLYVVIVSILLTIIVGWVYNDVDSKRTIDKTKETDKRIMQKEDITIETEIDKGDDIQAVVPVSLGEFKLTAYCSCSICCGKWANNRPIDENGKEIVYGSIGEKLQEGYSIAIDPSVIPYGTEVVINRHTYKAQDCGGAIKGNEIDVYFEDHNKALEFGVQYAEVFIK